MALTELNESNIQGKSIVGKPVMVINPPIGFPDYSDRVRAMVDAQSPEEATAFVVGNLETLATPVEVKVWWDIIGSEDRKHPLGIQQQTWYAHAVQYLK